MKRFLFLLLLTIYLTSCDNPHYYEKYYGIYIDRSLRQGSGYKDSAGIKYWYYYVKTVITNDSLVPAHVRLNVPKGFYQTALSNGNKYKVFLLSESMATENEFDSTGYYLVSGQLKKYFDSGLENLFILDTVLKPKEACTVYIGLINLGEGSNGMNPDLSLFSRGHKPHFGPKSTKYNSLIPDSAINKFIVPTEKSLNLFLGISNLKILINEPGKNYNIIPCGQVSYSN